MPGALFTPDAGRFVPSEHTRGPWDAGAQHGGAPAALIGRAMEMLPTDTPMSIVRTTVEILRPVPLRPLEVSARVERSGRRVQLLSASLSDGHTELCRASAWRMRTHDLDLGSIGVEPPPFKGPAESTPHVRESDEPAFHRTGVVMRYAKGAFIEQGPATVWLRLAMPLVEGETPTPLQRTLAAADFGNGVGAALPWGEFVFINTDLTVSLTHSAHGDWIGLDAYTDINAQEGRAVAYSRLYDERGPIGHAMQSLFVQRRTPA